MYYERWFYVYILTNWSRTLGTPESPASHVIGKPKAHRGGAEARRNPRSGKAKPTTETPRPGSDDRETQSSPWRRGDAEKSRDREKENLPRSH